MSGAGGSARVLRLRVQVLTGQWRCPVTLTEIFVRLLDENVDVWRPVNAERIASDRFRIVEQPYDRGTERWEFEPGDEVICELVDSDDEAFLAATKRP
jgi:hypothetical protein